MGGRIPTAEEVRAMYDYTDVNKAKEVDSILSRKISAVKRVRSIIYLLLPIPT